MERILYNNELSLGQGKKPFDRQSCWTVKASTAPSTTSVSPKPLGINKERGYEFLGSKSTHEHDRRCKGGSEGKRYGGGRGKREVPYSDAKKLDSNAPIVVTSLSLPTSSSSPGSVCGKEDETPVLSGSSSSSGEAHIYGSSCAFDVSARTSFRGVKKDKLETNGDKADKNSLLKWGKITSPTSILGTCCQRSETLLRCLVYLNSGAKDAVFNVDSRRAVGSSKGLGSSGVKTICLCLTLETLFAAILFVIAVNFFKGEGRLKWKRERRSED